MKCCTFAYSAIDEVGPYMAAGKASTNAHTTCRETEELLCGFSFYWDPLDSFNEIFSCNQQAVGCDEIIKAFENAKEPKQREWKRKGMM